MHEQGFAHEKCAFFLHRNLTFTWWEHRATWWWWWSLSPSLSLHTPSSLTSFWTTAIDPQALGMVSFLSGDSRGHDIITPRHITCQIVTRCSFLGLDGEVGGARRKGSTGNEEEDVTGKDWTRHKWFSFPRIPHYPYFCNSSVWLSICISSKRSRSDLISKQALILWL